MERMSPPSAPPHTRALHHMRTADVHPEKVPANPAAPGSVTPRSHAQIDPEQIASSQAVPSSPRSQSPAFQLSSSDVSQITVPDGNNPDLTPPSSSTFSSQGHGSSNPSSSPNQVQSQPLAQEAPHVQNVRDPDSFISPSDEPSKLDQSQDLIAGQKRTASGQMKWSSITSIADLKKEQGSTRSSRTSSILSNGSNGTVVELSQQLRTRLSYAMVKVQNGWESRSLGEVESLASQQGSPRSSISGFQNRSNKSDLESPRTAMAADWRRKWSSSEGSDASGGPGSGTAAAPRGKINGFSNVPVGNANSRRALAPPVDFVSGTRRRPTPNTTLNGLHTTGPYTPSRQFHTAATSNPKQRTPSQNAAMEADAVETLLFMASPVNSGYHPTASAATESNIRSTATPISSQTSPLRSQFHFNDTIVSPRRKVGFMDTVNHFRTHADLPAETRDIDQILDEDDASSDDGLEEAINLANRRAKVGSGR